MVDGNETATAPSAEELEAQQKAEEAAAKAKAERLAKYEEIAVHRGASKGRAYIFALDREEKLAKGEVETEISSAEKDAMTKLFAVERIADKLVETLENLPAGTQIDREAYGWKVTVRTNSTTHYGHGKTLCEALADAGR